MSEVIRLSLDTEFNEEVDLGHFSAIDLISVGVVNVDRDNFPMPLENIGFYVVSSEFNDKAANENAWMKNNVLNRLFLDCFQDDETASNDHIQFLLKEYLRNEVLDNPEAKKVEFWAKNGSYDNVLLCRLFGGMRNLYDFMNAIGIEKTVFRDLNELTFPSKEEGTPKPEADEDKLHNSFYDACYQAQIIRWVEANLSATCTETAAMDAYLRRPRDPKDPENIEQAIAWGLVHN